jgi:hypothetical protein
LAPEFAFQRRDLPQRRCVVDAQVIGGSRQSAVAGNHKGGADFIPVVNYMCVHAH